MKSIAVAVLTAAALACAGTATAQQERSYIGGNIVWADYSASGSSSANPTMLAGRFGREFNRHFAVEGRLGLGIDDDAVAIEDDRFHSFRVDEGEMRVHGLCYESV